MKKISRSKNSKRYLEEKYDVKSKPISSSLKKKLDETSKNSDERIALNNSIYDDSNAHASETILIAKKGPVLTKKIRK